jgi:uroporphyrin-III C-methyltransferase
MPFIVCNVLGKFITAQLHTALAVETAQPAVLDSVAASKGKSQTNIASLPVVVKDIAKPIINGMPVIAPAASSGSSNFPTPIAGAALPLTFTPIDVPVLLVGANRLAASRAFSLLEAGAKVTIVSSASLETAHEEVRYRAQNKEINFIQKTFSEGPAEWSAFLEEEGIVLVCVTDTLIGSLGQRSRSAIDDIYQACKASRIPANISDHPHLSDYSFPSVHRFAGASGPSHLQVAVSTNGRGCRLSSRLKREIVTRLPPSVGAAVDNVGHLRLRAKSRGRDRTVSEDDPETPLNNPVHQLDTPSILNGAGKQLGEELAGETEDEQLRRMRWVHQMSEYYSFEALARMTEREMDTALRTWQDSALAAQPSMPQHDGQGGSVERKGRIFLIGSGPGHPGLLTLAAHHILRTATLILSDKLVPSEILALIPSTTELHIAKKFPGNNEGAQNELMVAALAAARRGETVVRLKQGDPFVYGRGGEEVLYFREGGFESTVIPGVTSAIAGPEMMGIPVTQRGVSEGMILCTGVGRAGKSVNLPGYVKPRTAVVLMGVARIGMIVSTLTDPESTGREGTPYPLHLPIAVVERASSPDQRVIVSTLANIAEAVKSVEERPPGMMVIGWSVLALEGKGRVDVLDDGVDEMEVVKGWMGGDRWRIREGLDQGWAEYLNGLGV